MSGDPLLHPSRRSERIHRIVGLEPPTLTSGDVARLSGIDHERTVRWWRALGFPEVPDDIVAFDAADVRLVARLAELIDGNVIEEADVLRLARLLGASFQRISEAQVSIIDDVVSRIGGSAPLPVIDLFEPAVVYVWRRHLLATMGRWMSPEEDDNGSEAVAFVDISGFTKLSKSVSSSELTEIIDCFEAVAFDVVPSAGGRVVKLIGDEVMFVAPTMLGAVRIGLELMRRLGEHDAMPPVHCGVAVGPTVSVGGDVFGPTVNLANRLTNVARAGTLVVPLDTIGELFDVPGLKVRRLRRTFDLKGIGDVKLATVSAVDIAPADIASADDEDPPSE